MIEVKDISGYIEQNKTPYVRIYDMNKVLLHIYDENDNVQQTIQHLESILPMFKMYGKIVLNCANEKMKNSKWTNSYYVTCVFDKAATPQMVGFQNQFNPWAMPPGFVHQDIMTAKLDAIQKEIALNREIDNLKRAADEKSKQDPFQQIEKIAPWAMYAMGKTTDEIVKVSAAMRIGNANLGSRSSAQALPGGALTFKDLAEKPSAEKEKQFQQLADSLSTKVSIEEMIILYKALDEDPSLVQTAIEALPLLKKT